MDMSYIIENKSNRLKTNFPNIFSLLSADPADLSYIQKNHFHEKISCFWIENVLQKGQNWLYSNLPPPRAFVDFIILKKATQALNGHALLFCVYMVKCTDSHIRYLCYIYQCMNLVNIVFYVSVQQMVPTLYFLLIMQSKTSKRKESVLGHQWICQDGLLA